MVKSIKPQAFDMELEGGSGLLLVAFLKRNERFAFQAEAVERVEQARSGSVRCFLFNADYLDTAMERFAVKGTPTFILFDQGREVGRLIGESDSDALNEFLGNYIG
ncbi:thioredoxin family protein [Pseudodesulfovibrio portus]|uniref:Thioredoxin domain-containing protein n=1 Tax=Pseudodesulfovibrio portus TaxID=231439 RepID=A0ABM8APA1_9BACT|nr:thioredoxin family protein [Pseudodesulfovibrio portus]BDQ33238.1 hypothetical protein JCM14722_07800 [Pseudodesulfovibrio portus]